MVVMTVVAVRFRGVLMVVLMLGVSMVVLMLISMVVALAVAVPAVPAVLVPMRRLHGSQFSASRTEPPRGPQSRTDPRAGSPEAPKVRAKPGQSWRSLRKKSA